MVLLDAVARLATEAFGLRGGLRAVATFDHGTGAHARESVALVRRTADALGIPVLGGVARWPDATEAAWRQARWAFLRGAAGEVGAAAIATAHTRDDQLETFLMRTLRGASARGLAGLLAERPAVVRPLVTVSREAVGAYAAACEVRWLEDPSNADLRHLRVRVRRDLLPALDRCSPEVNRHLLAVGERAAGWRQAVEAWAAAQASDFGPAQTLDRDGGGVEVAALADWSPAILAVFWPAFAARAGVRLDRRGVARLVAFTEGVIGRIAAGTVQPARLPLASDPAGATVALTYVRDAGSDRAARGWVFVVLAPEPNLEADGRGLAAMPNVPRSEWSGYA